MYKVKILPQADKDIRSYQKAGNKKAIQKIHEILKELQVHPTTGTGQPETYANYPNCCTGKEPPPSASWRSTPRLSAQPDRLLPPARRRNPY